jgi:hypothetical protein
MATAMRIKDALPLELRKKFEVHYGALSSIVWEGGESCSRCGAYVYTYSRTTHELWHENVSCQLWMQGEFVMTHLRQHERENQAISEVIGGILGFIDPPGEPGVEEVTAMREDGTVGNTPLTHEQVHEQGLPHEH